MRLTFLGYGGIAEEHAQAFKRLGAAGEGVQFSAVMGRVEESARRFADRHGFERATVSLDEALDCPADAVVIASPSDLHAEQTVACLRAEKHVLCEIPLSVNLDDALEAARFAESSSKQLMICHTQRFFPTLQELRRRVENGDFRLKQIVCRWGFLRRKNENWKGQKRSWTDNLLWHHGAHVIDMAVWMLGETEIVDVKGILAPPTPPLNIPLDLNMCFKTASGAVVSAAMSYNTRRPFHDYLFIGEEETYRYQNGKLYAADQVVYEGGASALEAQNAEFLAAVRGNRAPSVSAEEIMPAMRILQAVQDQSGAP